MALCRERYDEFDIYRLSGNPVSLPTKHDSEGMEKTDAFRETEQNPGQASGFTGVFYGHINGLLSTDYFPNPTECGAPLGAGIASSSNACAFFLSAPGFVCLQCD